MAHQEEVKADSKQLFQKGDMTITREHVFTPEIIEFLDNKTWGTEETLYEHKKTADRLHALKRPVLAVLRIKGVLRSMVVVENRNLQAGERRLKGYFFRYLAHDLPFRQRRLFGVYARKFIDLLVQDEPDEAVFYASVEGKNFRSSNMLTKLGYDEMATIGTLGYSRVFPKKDPRFSHVTSDFKQQVGDMIREYGRTHSLYHDDYIFEKENYFVLHENGEVIAGCQVHPATWVVKNLPGKFGNLLLKVVPYIPLLRSMVNPNKFEFISFEGLICKTGREQELIKLFVSVMHHFEVKVGLLWLDVKDDLFTKLSALGGHGLMKYFADDTSVKIHAIPAKVSAQTLEHMRSHPIYISSFDFI